MKCTLTKDCQGTLQLKPEQDDSIKYSLECDMCKEVHIVQRTRDELIVLYEKRAALLRAGIDIHSIYADEAQEILRCVAAPDVDLKYLPVAQDLAKKLGGENAT
jgi:hypothetical protein